MEKNNFIHVTTVEEGFDKCHELCKKYNLRIQEHYPEACYYCLKEEEAKSTAKQDSTLKTFAGKFSFLYDRMSQRLRDLMYKKNTEFEVEDYDEDIEESFIASSYPTFDPGKYDSDPSVSLETSEKRIHNVLALSKSDKEKDNSADNLKISFDTKSRQVSINDTNKFTPSSIHRKVKKEFRNRSSEFSKQVLQRDSTEL